MILQRSAPPRGGAVRGRTGEVCPFSDSSAGLPVEGDRLPRGATFIGAALRCPATSATACFGSAAVWGASAFASGTV